MNDLHTKKALRIALFATALFSSYSTLANRPAVENNTQAKGNMAETMATAQPEVMPNNQPAMPSSVDLMMQQQTHQTGDIVQLPAKEIQPGETLKIQLLDFPRRGMSMDKVQHTYGEPIAISESVGKPPITRWTYNDRVVYFEYATVLHVVAR